MVDTRRAVLELPVPECGVCFSFQYGRQCIIIISRICTHPYTVIINKQKAGDTQHIHRYVETVIYTEKQDINIGSFVL